MKLQITYTQEEINHIIAEHIAKEHSINRREMQFNITWAQNGDGA